MPYPVHDIKTACVGHKQYCEMHVGQVTGLITIFEGAKHAEEGLADRGAPHELHKGGDALSC